MARDAVPAAVLYPALLCAPTSAARCRRASCPLAGSQSARVRFVFCPLYSARLRTLTTPLGALLFAEVQCELRAVREVRTVQHLAPWAPDSVAASNIVPLTQSRWVWRVPLLGM